MKKVKKFFENGRTMLEMLAVLAIIASIGIGISAGITHGLTVYHASVLQTQLPQIKKAIETTYSFNPKINKYADIDSITGQQYISIFGDILGKEACTNAGCKTAGGLLSLHAIVGGKGFKVTFTDMPKGICQELADVARGENNSILSSGFVMANPCNEDSKQEIDFATITEEYEKCRGNQFLIDGECKCLNSDAIGEECKLPNKETPPVTTTTTTMVLMTSEQKKTEATELTSTLTLAVESTSSIIYNSNSGTTPTETTTPETTTPNASQTYNSETPTTTATYATEESTTTMTTYVTETPTTITTYVTETSITTNGIANVEGGNTTITVATETPTTTAMTTSVTATPITTDSITTTTGGVYGTETSTPLTETTTPDVSTETSTPLTETTTPDVSTETSTPLTETTTPDVSTETSK